MENFSITRLGTHIGEDGHPYISVQANGFKGDLLVDTGFSDGLSLPNHLEKKFSGNLNSLTRYTLGDGKLIELRVYLVKLLVHEKTLGYCSTIFVERDSGLVGIDFFRLLKKELRLKWQPDCFALQ